MLTLATAVSATACATRNFTDPYGPRYTGTHGSGPLTPREWPFRIVSFNIKFGREIDRAVALLQRHAGLQQPDVLLLQEMDRSGVERLAAALHLNYVYFPSSIHPWSDREFGTAVLSPWSFEQTEKLVLPHQSFVTNVRRAATSALVRRGDQRLRVISVHLPAPGSINDDQRLEQVQRLADSVALASDPVVIGGDFNARRVGSWFTQRGFTWLTRSLPGTMRAFGRWWSYDHLFARGLEPAADGWPAAGVVDPGGASDHRAVWVRVVPLASR